MCQHSRLLSLRVSEPTAQVECFATTVTRAAHRFPEAVPEAAVSTSAGHGSGLAAGVQMPEERHSHRGMMHERDLAL